jgi:hypothetical protein
MLKHPWLILCLVLLMGCETWFEKQFRAERTYQATRSGYQLQLIFQGVWDSDSDMLLESQRLVQICPLKQGKGRPLRFQISTQNPKQGSYAATLTPEDSSLPPRSWSNDAARGALGQLLQQAGYGAVNVNELAETVGVLDYKGRMDQSQSKHLTLVNSSWERHSFNRNSPQSNWIPSSELPPCD